MASSLSPMLGIYLGAFLGPLGGNVVHVLLPALQHAYAIDVQLAALSVTAYMVPFAAGQFVSGALADRYGRRPVLVAGFAGFGVASLGGALAPTYGAFLAARAAQGLANACTTPILMAALGDVVEPRRLGRAVGWFGAANTAGLFLAPLVSGALAALDWRLVYLSLAVTSSGLTLHYVRWLPTDTAVRALPRLAACRPQSAGSLPGCGVLLSVPEGAPGVGPPSPRGGEQRRGTSTVLRGVVSPRLAALCLGAMLGYLSLNGVGFLVVLYVVAAYGLDAAQSGLLLSGFGLANMLAAGPAGVAVDRVGSLRVSTAGALGAAAVLALLPMAPGPPEVGALLLAGGVAVAGLWAGLTTVAVQAAPERRATASALFNAWKFIGYAVAPLVYAPVYTALGATAAFTVAAAASLAILLPLAALARLSAPGREAIGQGAAPGGGQRAG